MTTLILKTVGTVFLHELGDYKDLRCDFTDSYENSDGNLFTSDWDLQCEIKSIRDDLDMLSLESSEIELNKDYSNLVDSADLDVINEIKSFMRNNDIEKIEDRIIINYKNQDYIFKDQSSAQGFLSGINAAACGYAK